MQRYSLLLAFFLCGLSHGSETCEESADGCLLSTEQAGEQLTSSSLLQSGSVKTKKMTVGDDMGKGKGKGTEGSERERPQEGEMGTRGKGKDKGTDSEDGEGSITPTLAPGGCTNGQSPHQDYPDVCVNSALETGDVSCPASSTSSTSEAPEYPHALMTKQCPDAVLTTQCLTSSGYADIVANVTAVLDGLDDKCSASSCPRGEFAGCVLRMAGHDFMDFQADQQKGGSDGCTDMNAADNKGLAPCLVSGENGASLLEVYQKFCTSVSFADFLVIAAEAAMRATGGPDFAPQFKYGRTTSTECPESAHHLPNPENGCSAVKTTFLDNMGLDWRGAAALMGVHTLGRAKPENSGYSGWWSDPQNSSKFNNDYYVSLRNKGWNPMRAVCGNEDKNQWLNPLTTGDATEMMLDTDMCLAFHIKRGAAGENCCGWLNRCHRAVGFSGAIQSDGADDFEQISWAWKIDSQGNNVSNPNGCWHYENDAIAARMSSRGLLCGDDDVADCGMSAQEGEFMGVIKGIGNTCKAGPDGHVHCSSSSSLSGIAHEYITEFASDQEAWFSAFLDAWQQATRNGFPVLHSLKDTC